MVKRKNTSMVISLGDDGAIISCFTGTSLLKRVFVTSPSSSDFHDLVREYSNATIYLLLDTIDQNYVFSNIPNVGKANVNKIIKRKIKTEFDQNDINTSLFLGKETIKGKPNMRYVFISVRSADPFKVWMDSINQLSNKFGGIYLIPLEAEEFIKRVRKSVHGDKKSEQEEWCIFISYNRVGGFRQIVLKNGKLIFTRISQSISLQTPDAIGKNISQEAANTLEYIRRIGFFDQPLSVYIICSKEAANFIEVPGVRESDVHVFNPHELAQKLGYHAAAQENDKFGDVIFASNFISSKHKVLKLSTKESSTSEKLNNLSTGISIVSKLIMAALPVAIAYFMYQALSSNKEIDKAFQDLSRKKSELTEVKDFEKEYGINPQTLMDMVKTKNTFDNRDTAFFDILKKYQEADKFSRHASQVILNTSERGQKTVDIQAIIDISQVKNYGDVLYQVEQFTTAIKEGMGNAYEVQFTGLPSEKDIRVDMQSRAQQQPLRVTVNIKEK